MPASEFTEGFPVTLLLRCSGDYHCEGTIGDSPEGGQVLGYRCSIIVRLKSGITN
jgi:hypothetical protein